MGLDVVPLRRAQTQAPAAFALKPLPAIPIAVLPTLQLEPMDDACAIGRARSASVPASFQYGGVPALASRASTASTASTSSPASSPHGLRPRSFDSWGPSSASDAKAASLHVLNARIQAEQRSADARADVLRRRRHSGSALLRSVATLFSSKQQEAAHLRRMQYATEAAKAQRSLAILHDIRTLVLMTEDNTINTPRASLVDAAIQRLLDGAVSADDVLLEDGMHHVLALQAEWLRRSAEGHQRKDRSAHRARSASCMALQAFLERVEDAGVPIAFDAPTSELLEFEHLITRHRLMKPKVKRAFDGLCSDTMALFTSAEASNACIRQLWDARAPQEVLGCVVDEIVESILEEAWVAASHRATVRVLVEQMVFSRLAAVCYRDHAVELDEQNTQWRERVLHARHLSLRDLGISVDIDIDEVDDEGMFPQSVAAFNRLPHLVPSSVLAAFLQAIRVLYLEAGRVLGRASTSLSADVILPLLVYVLSRCDLPHLHSQIFLMEEYAGTHATTKTSHDGSEAAYYLATLQAAVGYIMTLP